MTVPTETDVFEHSEMKEAVKSVSVETYHSIAKTFFGTHILTRRRKEVGRHKKRHPQSAALSVTTAITEPFCCITESAGALLPWGGLRGTKEKEPD